MRRTPARNTNSWSYIPTEDVAVRLDSVHCPGVECGEETHGWLVFSPLLALATYLNHVHHVQCACGCSVLAWHWQRTWTGVGYASKRNTADPRKAQSSPSLCSFRHNVLQVERTASLLHVWRRAVMGGQALCESRPRGTAFSHVNVLHCTSNSLVPYGLLPQVKRQHFLKPPRSSKWEKLP